MPPGFRMSVVFPLLCGVMALLLLMIGLRGILTKKPFVISGRWGFAIVLLTFFSDVRHGRLSSTR